MAEQEMNIMSYASSSSSSPHSSSRFTSAVDVIGIVRAYDGSSWRANAKKYLKRLVAKEEWLAPFVSADGAVPVEIAVGMAFNCEGRLDTRQRQDLACALCRGKSSREEFERVLPDIGKLEKQREAKALLGELLNELLNELKGEMEKQSCAVRLVMYQLKGELLDDLLGYMEDQSRALRLAMGDLKSEMEKLKTERRRASF